MSRITSVLSVLKRYAYTLTDPVRRLAGTITLFATTSPSQEFRTEVNGRLTADAHAVRNPIGPVGTAVMFRTNAWPDTPQALDASGKSRLAPPEGMDGLPK